MTTPPQRRWKESTKHKTWRRRSPSIQQQCLFFMGGIFFQTCLVIGIVSYDLMLHARSLSLQDINSCMGTLLRPYKNYPQWWYIHLGLKTKVFRYIFYIMSICDLTLRHTQTISNDRNPGNELVVQKTVLSFLWQCDFPEFICGPPLHTINGKTL